MRSRASWRSSGRGRVHDLRRVAPDVHNVVFADAQVGRHQRTLRLTISHKFTRCNRDRVHSAGQRLWENHPSVVSSSEDFLAMPVEVLACRHLPTGRKQQRFTQGRTPVELPG